MSYIWSGMVTPSPSGDSISWPHLNGDENNENENNENEKMNFQLIDLPPQVKNPGTPKSGAHNLEEFRQLKIRPTGGQAGYQGQKWRNGQGVLLARSLVTKTPHVDLIWLRQR